MRDIRFGCLPSNFFGGGTFTSRIISSKNRIYIPHRPVMFHANYTLGIANKIALLEKVRELNKQNEIIVLFNNFSFKSRKKHRRNIKIVGNILLSNQRRIIELDSYSRPRYVCIEASTVCQLNCVSCPTSNKIIHKVFGSGFLSFNDYKHFIEAHPWITKIELSNWGEVFLNPELTKILEFSQQKNILLTIDNGANMNAVPEKVLEALVRCRVQSISCSIDGASEETYSVYRVNGSYNQVIKNIRRLNEYKQQYGCDKPRLKWQFVAFGHNEHEIGTARSLASNLGMQFHLKLSWDDLYINTFSPIANKELIRTESGLGVADRKEFEDKYKRNYVDQCCLFFFLKPHINFDGKLLGCGINHWSDFGNVFHEGMENCIKGERYQYTRQMLMGLRPERKDIPCIHCKIYNFRKTRNNYVTKEQLKNFPF